MPTDRERVKSLQTSQFASNSDIESTAGNAKAVVQGMHRKPSVALLMDNATAATDVGEYAFYRAKRAVRLVAADVLAAVNAAASGNCKVITVAKRTAGGAATTLATYNTGTTALQEWCASAMTLSTVAGALDLALGDVATIKTVKAGSGIALTGGTAGSGAISPCAVFCDWEDI